MFLIERAVPGAEFVPAGRQGYRAAEHRLLHRRPATPKAAWGRDSRENRAVRLKSGFGRQIEATRWSQAEFATLKQLWRAGVRVPYPVQVDGGEILMEFIGDGRAAAPRLAQTDPDLGPVALAVGAGGRGDDHVRLAATGARRPQPVQRAGARHGRPEPELVIIDVPQVLDLVSNPNGVDFLHRDCRNLADWFVRKGLPVDADVLLAGGAGCRLVRVSLVELVETR